MNGRCRARTSLLLGRGSRRRISTRRRGPVYGSTSRTIAPLDWWTFVVMKLRVRSQKRRWRALMTTGASWARRTSGATASPGATRTSGGLWRRLRLVRQARLSDVYSRGSRACAPSRAIPRSEGSARAATTRWPCPGTLFLLLMRRFVFLGVVTCVKIKVLRRVPRHRCGACSMAWRCRFTAGRSARLTG